jgi:Virulence factor BrkB
MVLERPPLWAIGLSVLLIAIGLARRRAGEASPANGDRRQGETGRGRSAETPSEIPARGWKDILWRVYRGVSENRILLVAAGVTFYALLAIFPGIAALISIYGLFADPASVASHLDAMANVAPGGAIDILREEMTRLASQGGATLGVSFLVSFAISFWTRQLRGQSYLRCAKHCLRRRGKAQLYKTQYHNLVRHAWYSCIYPAYARGSCRRSLCSDIHSASWGDCSGC